MEDFASLKSAWKEPRLVAKSDKIARPDQDNPLDASEYLDDEDTLQSKVKAVGILLRRSKLCLCYTGAGISKSSGIADYATKATSSVARPEIKLKDPGEAQPTPAHDALASLYRAGFVKEFINQNHDGLFEKAGVSVRHSNLIHGDWFDLSNPVVQYDEDLRSDLYKRLLKCEKMADLVLVAGTSLSGMNADRVAYTCAGKYMRGAKGILGTVLVNLQKTDLDKECTVRVWCKTDDFFTMLAKEMEVEVTSVRPAVLDGNIFHVPYDENGRLLNREKDKRLQILDLSPGAHVKVIHPGANNFGKVFVVLAERDIEGNYLFNPFNPKTKKQRTTKSGWTLGRWFVLAFINGELEQLPCVNENPTFISSDEAFSEVKKLYQ